MDIPSLILLATEATAEHAAGDGGVLGTLGINWKLFLAQLVNFGIVVFILWRWVFRPVVGALESRRQKIETSIKQAQEIEERMKKFEIEQEEVMKKARAEAQGIIEKSQVTAEASGKETVVKARAEAEKIVKDAAAKIEADKDRAIAEAREELANLTVMATEKIIRTKLDEKKDREFVKEVLSSIK